MKRYYNKTVCSDWVKVDLPEVLFFYGDRKLLRWCQNHRGVGRFYQGATGFWFEDSVDAEKFSAEITFLLLAQQ